MYREERRVMKRTTPRFVSPVEEKTVSWKFFNYTRVYIYMAFPNTATNPFTGILRLDGAVCHRIVSRIVFITYVRVRRNTRQRIFLKANRDASFSIERRGELNFDLVENSISSSPIPSRRRHDVLCYLMSEKRTPLIFFYYGGRGNIS